MSSSQQIYLTVFRRLKEVIRNERLTRRRNLALFVVALYLASSCALTRLADHLLVNGKTLVTRARLIRHGDEIGRRYAVAVTGLRARAAGQRVLSRSAALVLWTVVPGRQGALWFSHVGDSASLPTRRANLHVCAVGALEITPRTRGGRMRHARKRGSATG